MNTIGKKFFHFLFLLSALFVCRACAMYFLGIERNFQCPICNLLKGASTDVKTVFLLCDETISVSSSFDKVSTHSKTTKFQNPDCNSVNGCSSIAYTAFRCCLLVQPKVLNIASNKLYLLFKRLKIGDGIPNNTV